MIKSAIQNGLITDGHCWVNILEKCNSLTHTYSEAQAIAAIKLIKGTYPPAIDQVYQTMKSLAIE